MVHRFHKPRPTFPEGPTGIPYVQPPSTQPHYSDPTAPFQDPYGNWWDDLPHTDPREQLEADFDWLESTYHNFLGHVIPQYDIEIDTGGGYQPHNIPDLPNIVEEERPTSPKEDEDLDDDIPSSFPDTTDDTIDDPILDVPSDTPTPPDVPDEPPGEAPEVAKDIVVDETRDKGRPTYLFDRTAYISIKVDGKTRYMVRGAVEHPCDALEGEKPGDFKLSNRKHRATGNSRARLRMIRRNYAYLNCK